jgi:hypothetical protein
MSRGVPGVRIAKNEPSPKTSFTLRSPVRVVRELEFLERGPSVQEVVVRSLGEQVQEQ